MLNKLFSFFGLGRRSFENPNVSLTDPAAWEALGLGGGTSSAGVTVNRETALTYDAVWRAVNLISGSVARIKLQVFKEAGKHWELDKQHPAYKLLKIAPMPEMTARVFKQTMTANAVLTGAGYAYIKRDGAAKPLELWPLPSGDVTPVREYLPGDGGRPRLWYIVRIGGEQRKVPAEGILCIMGLSPDGWTPYSVFDKARNSIGLGMAQGEYTGKFFSNNAEPRVLIEVPAASNWKVPAQQEFLRQWNAMHQGLDNSHRTAILTGGATVKPYSLSAKDTMLIDSRKFSVVEVANWFGVPPHKLGNADRAAYNSLEQENQSFMDDCLETWFQAWEEECELKLLTCEEHDAESNKVEFSRRDLVRPTQKERVDAYSVGINARIWSPNECRAKEGEPPYEGGDEYLVPLNINKPGGNPDATPQGEPPKPDEPPDPEEPPEDPPPAPRAIAPAVLASHRELLKDACRRAVKRLGNQIRRAAEKPDSFLKALDGLRSEHESVVNEMIQPAALACDSILGLDGDRSAAIVGQMFTGIHADLLKLAECKRSELSAKVLTYLAAHEQHAPGALANLIIKESPQLEGVL